MSRPASLGRRFAGPKARPPRGARAVIVDFDGTVTEHDLLDEIAATFGDPAVYREVEDGLVEGRLSLREVISREFEPVREPLEDVVAWALERARIRPGFAELVRLARDEGWRLVVVSSGFRELIEPILEREGLKVELHANRVEARPEGWRVLWQYDDSCASCGESCKRSLVKALAGEEEIVYIGDGYSDRCAALASDRVFATRALAAYLEERDHDFDRFHDFYAVARALAP